MSLFSFFPFQFIDGNKVRLFSAKAAQNKCTKEFSPKERQDYDYAKHNALKIKILEYIYVHM
jgi:hypothetical protein